MFKENKFTTIVFIIFFGALIGLLIYTPFYLREYRANRNITREEEKQKKQEEIKEQYSQSTQELPNNNESEEQMEETINLHLTIEVNGKKYPATLEDNETSRAFIKKLPLELNMTELNGNEKYYTFNEELPSNPTTVSKINKGDLMLYNSNTLVLFYDTFNTTYSYTKIANISDEDNGMLKTNLNKNSKVKFYQ